MQSTTVEITDTNLVHTEDVSIKTNTIDWTEICSILEKQLFFPINDENHHRAKLQQAFSAYCMDTNNKGIPSSQTHTFPNEYL